MITLNQANDYTEKLFLVSWVKWVHEGSKPAENSFEKSSNNLVNVTLHHCSVCLNLNGCCFAKDKYPVIPLHPNCHCKVVDIPSVNVYTETKIEKFTKYVFVPSLINDKNQLFTLWGYNILDSEYLKQEFENQAKLAYMVGDYNLSRLDGYGQRINIKIKLKNKNTNEYVTFYSGWMTYPNGRIVLITPYGGE